MQNSEKCDTGKKNALKGSDDDDDDDDGDDVSDLFHDHIECALLALYFDGLLLSMVVLFKVVFLAISSPNFLPFFLASFLLSNPQLNSNTIFFSTKMTAENNDFHSIFVIYALRRSWKVLFRF